jgi:probable HAF family extracellular repeat protein
LCFHFPIEEKRRFWVKQNQLPGAAPKYYSWGEPGPAPQGFFAQKQKLARSAESLLLAREADRKILPRALFLCIINQHTNTMKTLRLLSAICLTFLLTQLSAHAQISVRAIIWDSTNGMQSIGSFGGDSYASGINDSGQVTGWSYYADNTQRAFIWTLAGGMVDLGSPGSSSVGNAINAAGNVVGSGTDLDNHLVAFYWTPADGMVVIGRGQAYAINDRNEVTGQYSLADGSKHTFFWSPRMRAPQDLGTLSNGWDTIGLAINNLHHVAGFAYDDSGAGQTFVWNKSGGFHLFDNTANSIFAAAYGISDRDEIVGYTFANGTHYVGIYVRPNGRTFLLPGLGGPDTNALAINEVGQIAGYATTPILNSHATLWTAPTSAAQDLGSLNNNSNLSSTATGINNLGQVVGWSQD